MTAHASRPNRQRLDLALVARGLASTRARARDLVLRGDVSVDGMVAAKPAMLVDVENHVALLHGPSDYVSRGTLKLRAALAHFGFDTTGRIGLDIGASTGGFTQALIEDGASRVFAIENGHGQLHPSLIGNPRVISFERTDARKIDRGMVSHPIGAIVADVSFISLTKVLPPALALAANGCWLIALVKPQFEGDPHTIPRDGVVKDADARASAVERINRFVGGQPRWRVTGTIPSPIHGGDGNIEFLLGAVLDD
ncbi:MAG: TlyA family RNA methyltransferase [Hyphomicrobiaceae bacterium]